MTHDVLGARSDVIQVRNGLDFNPTYRGLERDDGVGWTSFQLDFSRLDFSPTLLKNGFSSLTL